MKKCLLITSVLLLAACNAEPGSEKWCKQKQEQPKSEWSMDDATTYAKNCVFEGMAIGSKEWCEELEDKPKGEWTANETTSYAKHCVM